jgi:hypothetical protein
MRRRQVKFHGVRLNRHEKEQRKAGNAGSGKEIVLGAEVTNYLEQTINSYRE